MKKSGEAMESRAVLKYAGAFMAWVIGSGFATGQEVLRFFASYGYVSYGILLVNLVGFLVVGKTLMLTGYEHRQQSGFQHFRYYCGNRLGSIYVWTMPIVWFSMMAILFSAAGATLFEYFGINHCIGAAIMAALVLFSYLIGFERFVQIVSKISPVVIIFCLAVGMISVARDFEFITQVSDSLTEFQASPNWVISAFSYLSLDFLTGSTYYTNLGMAAKSRRAVIWGAILGSIILLLVITIMNTAILLNGQEAAALSVPTLFLAKKISYMFAGAFSVILLLGMFSSCAATMWSICSNFFAVGSMKNKITAVIIVLAAYIISLFPFGSLVGMIFPLIGYYGFIYIGCVIYKGLKRKVL